MLDPHHGGETAGIDVGGLALWQRRSQHERSCSTLSRVSTGMGDRLLVDISSWYVAKPARSTQSCIFPGSLNRVPALIGWDKGGNITVAGITQCDAIWLMSCSGGVCCELLYSVSLLYFTYKLRHCERDVRVEASTGWYFSSNAQHTTSSVPRRIQRMPITLTQFERSAKHFNRVRVVVLTDRRDVFGDRSGRVSRTSSLRCRHCRAPSSCSSRWTTSSPPLRRRDGC